MVKLINSMATILFVDDEPLTLKLLSQAAEITGHHALTAHNKLDAIASAEDNCPDLIFTDLNLGESDGVDLAEELRENPETSKIPVIILSAAQEHEMQRRAVLAGVERYLSKPIKIQTLIDVIREYTGQASAQI